MPPPSLPRRARTEIDYDGVPLTVDYDYSGENYDETTQEPYWVPTAQVVYVQDTLVSGLFSDAMLTKLDELLWHKLHG